MDTEVQKLKVSIVADVKGLLSGTAEASKAQAKLAQEARAMAAVVEKALSTSSDEFAAFGRIGLEAGEKVGKGSLKIAAAALAAGKATSEMAQEAAGAARMIVSEIGKAGAAVQQFGGTIKSAGSQISSLGTTLSIGVTAPLSLLGGAAIKAAGDMEQSQIAFTKLLGSADAAKAYLKDLQAFAAATPFNFEGVKAGAQQLMAFGFAASEIKPMLTSIGDSLSAMGNITEDGVHRAVIALGQMRQSGTVLKQDLNQLIALNIPVFDILRDKLHLTADQMKNIGDEGLQSSVAITALLEGLNERFGGSMQAQSQTLLGLWSTFRDQASFILVDLGQEITRSLDLKAWAGQAIGYLSSALDWFKSLSTQAKDTAIGIGIFAASLGPALLVLGQVVTVAGSLVTVIGFMATPLGLVAAGIAGFGLAMADALVSSQQLRDGILLQWPQIKAAFGDAWTGMQSILAAAKDAMMGDWAKFGTDLEAGTRKLGDSLKAVWSSVMAAMMPVAEEAFNNLLAWIARRVADIPGMVWQGWKDALGEKAFYAFASDAAIAAVNQKKAGGGLISGPGTGTSDSILAAVSNGEGINTAAAMRKPANVRAMNFMNAGGTIPGFASGGLVGGGVGSAYMSPDDLISKRSMAVIQSEIAQHVLATEAIGKLNAVLNSLSSGLKPAFDGIMSGLADPLISTANSFADSLRTAQQAADDAANAEYSQAADNANGLMDFANGVKDASDAATSWIDGVYQGADAWLNASDSTKQLGASAAATAGAVNQLASSAGSAAAQASDMQKEYGDILKMQKQTHDASASDLAEMDKLRSGAVNQIEMKMQRFDTYANTMEEKIQGVLGSIVADVSGMFQNLGQRANSMFAAMNKGDWSAQNGNPFVDLQAVRNMQEGNLRLLQVMDALAASGRGVKHGWDDLQASLDGRKASMENMSLAELILSQYTRQAATDAAHMADEVQRATDVVRNGGLYQAQAAQAAADMTSLATQTAAMGLGSAGQAALDTASMMGYASSALGSSAAAAASAISESAMQIAGAGAGALSAIAQQVAKAGLSMPESVLGQGTAGNTGPLALDQYQGAAGLDHIGGGVLSGVYSGGPRGSGSLAPGAWLNGPNRPIVLQIDGRQIWASIQDQGAHYGQQNTGAGWP